MDKKENLNTLQEISATEADWSREEFTKWWTPSKQLLKSIREYQKKRSQSVTSYAKSDIFAKFLNQMVCFKTSFLECRNRYKGVRQRCTDESFFIRHLPQYKN